MREGGEARGKGDREERGVNNLNDWQILSPIFRGEVGEGEGGGGETQMKRDRKTERTRGRGGKEDLGCPPG